MVSQCHWISAERQWGTRESSQIPSLMICKWRVAWFSKLLGWSPLTKRVSSVSSSPVHYIGNVTVSRRLSAGTQRRRDGHGSISSSNMTHQKMCGKHPPFGEILSIIQLLFRTNLRASERETSIDRVKKIFPASFQVMADGSWEC